MIEQFRRFLASPAGKIFSLVVTLGLLGFAVYSAKAFFRGDTPLDALYPTYIDTENGKTFKHENAVGETIPILSPFSGRNTGVPAEACYWTKDGKPKSDPTWVLLNSAKGEPEPTFCPDCGRLVIARNPGPVEGQSPPPTREEWFARHRHN